MFSSVFAGHGEISVAAGPLHGAAIYYRCSNYFRPDARIHTYGAVRRALEEHVQGAALLRRMHAVRDWIVRGAQALAKAGRSKVFKIFIKFSLNLSKNLTVFPTTVSILSARL